MWGCRSSLPIGRRHARARLLLRQRSPNPRSRRNPPWHNCCTRTPHAMSNASQERVTLCGSRGREGCPSTRGQPGGGVRLAWVSVNFSERDVESADNPLEKLVALPPRFAQSVTGWITAEADSAFVFGIRSEPWSMEKRTCQSTAFSLAELAKCGRLLGLCARNTFGFLPWRAFCWP